MFINAGLNKFLDYMPMPENIPEESLKDFQALMEIAWLMPLIALAEIMGGLLIIIPKTRALGALILFPVMVGILLANFLVDTSGLVIVLPLTAIFIWILIENKEKYRPLFQ
jgi:uncharacterized membrane protein YphA (DoxX/SURF4 family)